MLAQLRTYRAPATDEAPFREAFRRNLPTVRHVLRQLAVNRADVDDLAQEVFMTLLERPPSDANPAALRAWLVRVAVRQGLNANRASSRRTRREAQVAGPTSSEPMDVAHEKDQARHRVRVVFNDMQPRAVKILLLRYHGLSYAEIAEEVDIAPGSVGTLLVRAQRSFRDAYVSRFGLQQQEVQP